MSRATILFAGLGLTCQVVVAQSTTHQNSCNKAVERAIAFVDNRGFELDLQVYIVYKYLERKFEISPISDDLEYDKKLRKKAKEFPDTKAYLRLLSPKMGISKKDLSRGGNPIDEMTSKALYCDLLDLDTNYLNLVKHKAARGGYSLPHAALSMQWLKENKCFSDTGVDYASVLDTIVRDLLIQVDTAEGFTDTEIECIAMLYYTGHGSQVKAEWFSVLLSQQLKNGGWAEKASRTDAIGHTTVLALWVLLEHLKPEENNTPWIVWEE
ncbi:MAG: hypothetical protein JKX73_09920 [Flavobacteriales bacterium]|nr:hypothetical protein [Flavobacteriales bacterium]